MFINSNLNFSYNNASKHELLPVWKTIFFFLKHFDYCFWYVFCLVFLSLSLKNISFHVCVIFFPSTSVIHFFISLLFQKEKLLKFASYIVSQFSALIFTVQILIWLLLILVYLFSFLMLLISCFTLSYFLYNSVWFLYDSLFPWLT